MRIRTRHIYFVLTLLAVAAPAAAQDGFDLTTARIVNAPDVRTWPARATITAITFDGATTRVSFTKQDGPDRWPDVRPAGWDGPLQYTLWLFRQIDGQWVGSAFIQFWHGRDASGSPADPDVPSVYDKHWFYGTRWDPIQRPGSIKPSELIGFLVTSGNQRDNAGPNSVEERSNVVVVPATDRGTFTFTAAPTPVSPVSPVSPESQPAQPVEHTAEILAAIADLKATMQQEHAEQTRSVTEALKNVGEFALKYLAPAVGGWIVAHQGAK